MKLTTKKLILTLRDIRAMDYHRGLPRKGTAEVHKACRDRWYPSIHTKMLLNSDLALPPHTIAFRN